MLERGLELSREKTVITHITDGFDFLGCNIRWYKDKLLTKPSLELRQKLQRQSELNSKLDLENEMIADVKSDEIEIKREVAMCR